MADNDTSKSTSTSSTAKSGGTRRNNTSSRSATNGKRSNASRRARNGWQDSMPIASTTVASLVGLGIALGFGLFATRRRWLPYAEEWGEYLQDGSHHDNGYKAAQHDDDDDMLRYAGDAASVEKDGGNPAAFPGTSTSMAA